MNIIHLSLRNYRRYAALELDMPNGVTAIVGRNGSGKSTVLEAIQFALYGAPALRTNKELVRFDGAAPADPVEVTLELELAGQAWRIERALRGKNLTPQASLAIDGVVQVPAGAGSSDAVTHHVHRTTGLALDAFRTTLVAQQKELARLADLPAQKRKQQILHMLGIDKLDKAIQEARAQRRDVESQLAGMRTMLRPISVLEEERKRTVADRDAASSAATNAAEANTRLGKELQDTQARREAALAAQRSWDQAQARNTQANAAQKQLLAQMLRLDAKIEAAQQARALAGQLKPAAERAAASLQALEAAKGVHEAARRHDEQLRLIGALEKRLAGIPEMVGEDEETLQTALDDATHAHAAAQAIIQHASQRQGKLQQLGADGECPTCDQPLANHLPKALASIGGQLEELKQTLPQLAERVAGARAALRDAQKMAQQAADRRAMVERIAEAQGALPARPQIVPELEPLQADVEATRAAREQFVAATARAEALDTLEEEKAARQGELDAASQAIKATTEALAGMEDPTPNLAALAAALRDLEVRAKKASDDSREAASRLASTTAQVAAANAALEQAKQQALRVAEMESKLHAWTALVGAKGGGLLDRFKDHMTGRIRPAIQAEAGRLLGAFTQGRYDEVILDDSYNLYVADGGIRYTLDRFSGGESDLVHLALRLAVSRLLAERGGIHLGFLALDEVFGSLDAQRTQAVVGALQGLSGIYQQVLVVTHITGLQDALDNVLEAVDDGAGATLRVHNG